MAYYVYVCVCMRRLLHLRRICIMVSSELGSSVAACSKSSLLAFSSATFTKVLESSPFSLLTLPVVMSYMKISCSEASLDLWHNKEE